MQGPLTNTGYDAVIQPRLFWGDEGAVTALILPENVAFDLRRPIGKHRGARLPPKKAASDTNAILFNIELDQGNEPIFLDPHDTKPKLVGSADNPDVKATIELIAFNSGTGDASENRATLRFDFGQDDGSPTNLTPVFWSIAAGMDLADLIQNKQKAAKSYRADFETAFSNRPIEVGGGIARLRLQIFRHKPPSFLKQLFSFGQTAGGKALVQALGFPGIVMDAVKILDEAIEKFFGDQSRPIFQSEFSTFAMSERARDEYTDGGVISIGVLNKGVSILTPAKHLATLNEQRPRYYKNYGLIPKGVSTGDFLNPGYQDPFEDVPYAVLRVNADEMKIAL